MMKLSKKRIALLIAAVVTLAGAGVCEGAAQHLRRTQISQQAAERWEGDGTLSYAQVSAFLTDDAGFYPTSADTIKESIDKAMVTASLEPANADAKLWYACSSHTYGTVSVRGTKRYASEASAIAIDGDFFRMHPWHLADGSYLSPDDLMQDRVVIDTQLAWNAFGSSEVAGLELEIDSKVYQIAGVIEPETDAASKTAYGDAAHVYLPFAALEDDGDAYADPYADPYADSYEMETAAPPANKVTCYEAVLPDPVRGFAEKTLTEALDTEEGTYIVVNTSRNSLKSRWNRLWHLREMVISSDAIAYPFWENAARLNDFSTSLLLLCSCILLIYPVLLGIWMLWKGYRKLEAWITRKRTESKRKFRTIERDPYSID